MNEKELKRRLRAIREPAPPPGLRTRLEQGIPDPVRRPESRWSPERMWSMARLGGLTAALVVIVAAAWWLAAGFLSGPAGPSAAFAAVLEPVVRATGDTGAVHLVMRMRTREGEDFSFVNLAGDMQKVEAWLQWPRLSGDPARARMEKGDRIYCFDGKETIFYHPRRREALRRPGPGVDFDLLWPAAWVKTIQNTPAGGVEVVTHDERGGRGRLVLREKGRSTEPLVPSFLGDFDRDTEVVWDLATHRLLGLRRWVYHGGERRLFAELVSIEYLPEIAAERFHLDLPDGIRWAGVLQAPPEMASLGPREVAIHLFEAARRGDRTTLELLVPSPSMVSFMLDERNRPTQIVFIGEPFHAGQYGGVYVPYKAWFGKAPSFLREFNLALKNDNEQHRWVLDGGWI